MRSWLPGSRPLTRGACRTPAPTCRKNALTPLGTWRHVSRRPSSWVKTVSQLLALALVVVAQGPITARDFEQPKPLDPWLVVAVVAVLGLLGVISTRGLRDPVPTFRRAVSWLRTRRVVIAVGLIVWGFAGAYPPWHARYPQEVVSCGFGPVWSGPSPSYPYDQYCGSGRAQIDLPRLLVEWAVVAGVTGGLAALARRQDPTNHQG